MDIRYAIKAPNNPLERKFWDAWVACGKSGTIALFPQARIGCYRVDFCNWDLRVVIEIDGHSNHSAPEDIAYDRKRQKEIERQGYYVMRFTGSELWRDASRCAMVVLDALEKRRSTKLKAMDGYKCGARVKHEMFGNGIILQVRTEDLTQYVWVWFESTEKTWFGESRWVPLEHML